MPQESIDGALSLLNTHWRDVQRREASVVALGNFDGVHLGHRQILDALTRESRQSGLAPVVITFEPHPRYYFKPHEKPSLLTTPWEKRDLLRQWPVDVISLAFDKELAELEPEEFIEAFLKTRLSGHRFLLGHNHRFGKRARGDIGLLQAHVPNPATDVLAMEPVRLEGETISSSAIRVHLEAAQIEAANRMLGRPFCYSGAVIHGEGRGRRLGFATANLDTQYAFKAIAAHGVYGGEVSLKGETYSAIANIGTTPTFGGEKIKIEVHILDFDESLYGQTLEFRLLFSIRPEKKFPSVEALQAQVAEDIAEVRGRLSLP